MHSISHSLAHRGPSASRARSRWQPYTCTTVNPTTPPTTLSRSPQTYLHTPSSIVLPTAPSSTYISPAIHLERTRSAHFNIPAKPLSAPGGLLREHKFKYVAGLVDQTVKSLCDIWQPDDIPLVFRAKAPEEGFAREPISLADEPLIHHAVRNIQLPSPISPSTQPSPISTSPITPTAQIAAASCRSSQVIPIRGFVHEVLRRSRTSTSVLQTALCYLEAVRVKVPELMQCEKAKAENPEAFVEANVEDRIVLADELYAAHGAETAPDQTSECPFQGPLTAPPTELLPSLDSPELMGPRTVSLSSKRPSPPLPPLPALPSPLLCPRRTFLACLILASKFLQDRSYSNKAWAKLAGLPPREIGRCERAVGEALEWRLWVGKTPSTATPPVGTHRAVARCRSESTLQLPTCSMPVATAPAAQIAPRLAAAHSPAYTSLSGLRRSATMPELQAEDNRATIGHANQSFFDAWMSSSASSAISATSDMEMSPAPLCGSQSGYADIFAPPQLGSIFAFVPSPPLSTPTLSYSPMSTASTASSDDGERTVQFASFVDMADQRVGSAGSCTGRLPSMPHIFGRSGSHPYIKLAAIAPKVDRMPIRLPSLSEAISHPALPGYQAQSLSVPAYGGVGIGAGSVSVYNSYDANWSVSG